MAAPVVSGVGKTKAAAEHWPAAAWNDVAIEFLSEERVQVTIGEHRWTVNYGEMGFKDRRTGVPNSAWVVLRELAKKDGTLVGFNHASKVKKQMQKLRRILRQHVAQMHGDIPGDPLPYIQGTGYRAAFTIECGPSFNS